MKTYLLALALAVSACAAPSDTSLVLKPSAEQIKAAKSVGNKLCPVSGEKLGSMGPGPVVVYKGNAVALCCPGCLKTFAKDPEKYLKVAQSEAPADSSSTEPAKKDHNMEGHSM